MKIKPRITGSMLLITGIGMILFFTFYDQLLGKSGNGFGPAQILGISLGLILFLVGGHLLFKSFLNYFFAILFAAGVFLSSLNIYGEFVSLRSPTVYDGSYYGNKFRIPQQYIGNGQDQLEKEQTETNQQYAHRLTERIYQLTIHAWDESTDPRIYNHQVPLRENYLLWALSYLEPYTYRYYQFCDPYKAIQRGVMICSQATEAIVHLWSTQTGLKARDMVLGDHVVAEVQVSSKPDVRWVMDADYGVVLEYDVAALEIHPELVIENYVNAGYDLNVAKKLAEIYGKDGNYVTSNTGLCKREEQLYKAKWYIPIILLGISIFYFAGTWGVKRYVSNSKIQ